MATPKKSAEKLPAKVGRPLNQPEVLKLETNVPMPERGVRDPEFVIRVNEILTQIKPRQSFVVPRVKLHTVKKLIKTQHASMIMKSAVIKPDERFARIWRVK